MFSINLSRETKGYVRSLHYYNSVSIGELDFICANKVAKDGTISLAFTRASDYIIVVMPELDGFYYGGHYCPCRNRCRDICYGEKEKKGKKNNGYVPAPFWRVQ